MVRAACRGDSTTPIGGGTAPAVVALVAGLPAVGGAATYHVNPQTGNNANAGTAAAPWRTPPGTRNTGNTGFISTAWGPITAQQKVACGDTILLRGGATQASAHKGEKLIDHGARAFCELLAEVDKFDVKRLAAGPKRPSN